MPKVQGIRKHSQPIILSITVLRIILGITRVSRLFSSFITADVLVRFRRSDNSQLRTTESAAGYFEFLEGIMKTTSSGLKAVMETQPTG